MTKQGARPPLTAPLLRLCAVGLLAAVPALTSRAAVDRNDGNGPGRWLGTRTLLQVHLPLSLSPSLCLQTDTETAARAREFACSFVVFVVLLSSSMVSVSVVLLSSTLMGSRPLPSRVWFS